jgi:D-alanyl-D-alanine carboxypeptidase/D-alanyl-D-alanine-endopeptidase (penicillin-binding protein 4)
LNRTARILQTAVAALSLGWCVTPVAAEAKPPGPSAQPTLRERLLVAARRGPVRSGEWAVTVQRIGDPKPLMAIQPDTPLILASTTKVFTSAAALDRLGVDYKFKTRLYADAPVGPDGVLPGHIVIVGGGDPAISGRLYDDDPLVVFRPWAEAIKAKGIRVVRDGLLLDNSFFDDERVHPDWPEEQAQNWWQAPVSALSYNDNVILVRSTGGLRPGAPARLGFYPAGPPLLQVMGRVLTVSGRGAAVGVRRASGSRTVVAAGLGDRPAGLEVGLLLDEGLALVALAAALREPELELGPAVLEVEAQRHDRQPFLVEAGLPAEDLALVREELAVALGGVTEDAHGVRPRHDGARGDPRLTGPRRRHARSGPSRKITRNYQFRAIRRTDRPTTGLAFLPAARDAR